MNIDDGPATDRRPTSHFETFQMAITLQRSIRSTSCLVLAGVFEDGSNSAISSLQLWRNRREK